jgi:hypothetical protein
VPVKPVPLAPLEPVPLVPFEPFPAGPSEAFESLEEPAVPVVLLEPLSLEEELPIDPFVAALPVPVWSLFVESSARVVVARPASEAITKNLHTLFMSGPSWR